MILNGRTESHPFYQDQGTRKPRLAKQVKPNAGLATGCCPPRGDYRAREEWMRLRQAEVRRPFIGRRQIVKTLRPLPRRSNAAD